NCSLGRKSCRSNVTYLKIKGFITKIKDLHPEKQVQILLRLPYSRQTPHIPLERRITSPFAAYTSKTPHSPKTRRYFK
ncbi:hypothetical protein QT711_16925, partial [Sporosarcina saromensis]|nr:hypothetical protein [Sporosarcina saromensis]